MNTSNKYSYSISGLDKVINSVVRFIFYYRLVIVIILFVVLGILLKRVWDTSLPEEKYKNIATVFTGGSIVIGIFYSILNYEYNQVKFKHDIKSSKETLSFNVAFEWHKPNIVQNLRITKKMYEDHKHLIDANKSEKFFKILETNDEARAALVSLFNYLECIAIGVDHGIMDSEFIKKFFASLFKSYYADYEFYISYRRKKHNAPNAWINFTNLAEKWNREP